MGSLSKKKKRDAEQPEERPAEQPDYESIDRDREVRRQRRRQNNTVLGSGGGNLGA